MLNVTVLSVGRRKEPWMREACAEYSKRLNAFCRLSVLELEPEPLPSKPSEAQIAAALHAEGRKLLAAVPNGAYVYALCIEGRQRSSEQFSRELQDLAVSGKSRIVFLIGSSFGLADEVKQHADAAFSMSEMTFPHQLARVMLMEQLYRAFEISAGGRYHK